MDAETEQSFYQVLLDNSKRLPLSKLNIEEVRHAAKRYKNVF